MGGARTQGMTCKWDPRGPLVVLLTTPSAPRVRLEKLLSIIFFPNSSAIFSDDFL